MNAICSMCARLFPWLSIINILVPWWCYHSHILSNKFLIDKLGTSKLTKLFWQSLSILYLLTDEKYITWSITACTDI